uniref:Ig-like domain-containing protein n=1 Tax=Cynoglossus semilaevis TaxID=244447 RepID=A0A3P8VKQ4_CYNSE
MNYWKFHVFILICVSTGVSDTKTVIQTPGHIVKRPEESVDREINFILWYKQDEHNSLKYLEYLNRQFPTIGSDMEGKITLKGDGSKYCTLTVSKLLFNDSGVYFCAASRQ